MRRQAKGSGTSPGGAIIEHGGVRVHRCGTGQHLALATAQIPGGNNRIDHLDSFHAERIETAWVDWSRAAGDLGEHSAGDNQRVAKACK